MKAVLGQIKAGFALSRIFQEVEGILGAPTGLKQPLVRGLYNWDCGTVLSWGTIWPNFYLLLFLRMH